MHWFKKQTSMKKKLLMDWIILWNKKEHQSEQPPCMPNVHRVMQPAPTEGNWVTIFWGNIGHAIHLPPLQKLALTWCESFGSNSLVCNKMNFVSACLLTYFSLWPYWFQIKHIFFFLSGKQTKGKRSELTDRRHLICYETVRLKKVFMMRAICPSAGPKHLGVRFSLHIKELVCLHAGVQMRAGYLTCHYN